jgi:hypothetical protein
MTSICGRAKDTGYAVHNILTDRTVGIASKGALVEALARAQNLTFAWSLISMD